MKTPINQKGTLPLPIRQSQCYEGHSGGARTRGTSVHVRQEPRGQCRLRLGTSGFAWEVTPNWTEFCRACRVSRRGEGALGEPPQVVWLECQAVVQLVGEEPGAGREHIVMEGAASRALAFR